MKRIATIPYTYNQLDGTYTIRVSPEMWPIIKDLFEEAGKSRGVEVEFYSGQEDDGA